MNTVKRISREEEFKKNPELKEEDLQHLREWYKKQPHFPDYQDEIGLILFLHSNFYRLEATKATIENHLTCRTHMPEIFTNRDPLGSKEIRKTMSTMLVIPLEKRTPEGYGIFYSRLINFEPDRFVYYDCMKLYNMISELWFLQVGTMPGQVFISDVYGVQMSHALRIPPMGLKKFMYFLQEAVPLRIKALHFVNTTPVMDFILNLMKPFVKKELMDVIHLHPNKESLAKYIPLEVMPNEMGGQAGPMMDLFTKVLKDLENHRDFFIEQETLLRVNESKRPGKPKTATDLFGVEGSFKKLDID